MVMNRVLTEYALFDERGNEAGRVLSEYGKHEVSAHYGGLKVVKLNKVKCKIEFNLMSLIAQQIAKVERIETEELNDVE